MHDGVSNVNMSSFDGLVVDVNSDVPSVITSHDLCCQDQPIIDADNFIHENYNVDELVKSVITTDHSNPEVISIGVADPPNNIQLIQTLFIQ